MLSKLTRIFLKILLSIFFDKKYLSGRFFDETWGGYVFALRGIFFQKILGFNRDVPWPCSPLVKVVNGKNIIFHPNDLNNFQSLGSYFQARKAVIKIGEGCYIAPNVGLITENHDPLDPDLHLPAQPIELGKKCWIGMNSVILPGVVLGDLTIVGAGSVVTKSFVEGRQVIVGSPARVVKKL